MKNAMLILTGSGIFAALWLIAQGDVVGWVTLPVNGALFVWWSRQ